MSKWTEHKKTWANCQRCELFKHRKLVVLARGTLPAEVLFVGEAPGDSEDALGKPFIGPAGDLLEMIIKLSGLNCSYAFTNMIACIPKQEEDGYVQKMDEPPKWAIDACADRLREIVDTISPRKVVAVSSVADKWFKKLTNWDGPYVTITHPAAILRQPNYQQGMAVRLCVARINSLLVSEYSSEDIPF